MRNIFLFPYPPPASARTPPLQDDITVEFERLRKEGVNPATAMWKASLVAQKKKLAAVNGSALTTGAQGAFAASAMAMFKDDEEGEGQLNADGVVSPCVCVCVFFCVFVFGFCLACSSAETRGNI